MVRTAVLMIAALCAAGFGAAPGPACSIEVTPFRPTDDLTYLWASAQPDTVLAGRGSIRPTGQEGHWGPSRDDSLVFGQVFRVHEYGGAHAGALDSALAADTSRQIVLVVWDYDAECEPTEWPRSARWAFPDSSLFLSAQLRDTAFWVSDRPTFDNFFAGEMAYPFDALTHSVDFYLHLDSVGLPYRRRTDGLSPAEVYRLVHDLPKPCDWRVRPIGAAGALAVAKLRHRPLLARFPANVILAEHERWSREAFTPDAKGALSRVCGS